MKQSSLLKGKDETLDSFYLGRILVLQKKKGYRFSVDAPLLAGFIQSRQSDEILELGTGSGIISLLLSIHPFKHITAVEIQETLVDLARRNVKLNHLEDKISIIHENLRSFQPKKKFDIIFSNPPYVKRHGGRLSTSSEKSIAKHELKCDIFDIMRKVAELLKEDGRAYFVFTAKRKEDFVQAVTRNGLKIRTLRFVHPRLCQEPNLFLGQCDFSSKEEMYLPPFILYDEKGHYSAEALNLFSGRIHDKASY